MSFENKKKFALWVHPETLEKVEQVYREDNCQSKSEFIEKAVDFYYGFLTSDNYKTFLPNVVTSTLKSIVAESDNRLVFHFKDGTKTVKRWQDRSRAESWTPEMKEAARQKAIERNRHNG